MRGNEQSRRPGAGAIVLVTAVLLALVALAFPAGAPANPPSQSAPTLFAFGLNEFGELGNIVDNGFEAPQPSPAAVSLPSGGPEQGSLSTTVATAAVGADHSLVVTTGGELFAFGSNYFGELGNASGISSDSSYPSPTPVVLPPGSGAVTAVAAGVEHSLVLTATGQVYAFGGNDVAQLGMPLNVTQNKFPTPALVTFPRPREGARVGGQPKITAIAAGGYSSYAITSTGELYAFGDDAFGQLASVSSDGLPTPIDLPGGNAPVTQIAAGTDYALALTSSGQLYGFGHDQYGQLGVPATTTPVVTPALVVFPPGEKGAITQVAAGGAQTLVVTASGQLYSFGSNQYGQLGREANVGSSAGNPTPAIVPFPPGAGPVRQISAAGNSSYAVTANGTLYAFGENYFGQLAITDNSGLMRPNPDPVPVTLPGGARVETLARGAGANHMLAIVSNLAVSTTALASGRVGVPYNRTVAATGGVEPYSWTATGLPHGLAISTAGEITGPPTAAGSESVVLTATDADGITVSSTPITLTITAASSTNTSGSTPTTTTGPTSSANLSARLRSQLAPHVTIGRLLQAGGYRLTLHGLGRATIAIRWRHRTSPHGSPVLVASGKAHLTATKLVVAIELTAAGQRLLAHAKHLGLTVAATLTPGASKAISVTLTVTISRHKAVG
jgi:alpha-tubulin suppressor-like RCC1 family protein